MNEMAAMAGSAAPDDTDDDAPLPWATWLRVSTRRLKRDADERAEVLAAEEIEPAQWALADRFWNLTIAESLAGGDFSLAEQMAAACARELAERKQAPSPPAPASDEPAAPATAIAALAPAPEVPAPLAAMPTPSPLAEPPPAPPMGAPGSGLQPSFLRREPSAHQPAAAPVSPAHAMAPAPPVPPPVVAPTGGARTAGKTPLDMGTAIGAIPGVPALPFGPSAPGNEGIDRLKQHVSEAQPAAAPTRTPIGATEAVDVGALARRVLVFGPPKVGEPAKVPAGGHPPQAQAQAQAAIPMLTVEQYASLCVDLEVSPHGAAEALRRYGVTPDGKRTLDDGWARVFTEQPARRAAFEHAKMTYRAWLARGGR